MITDQTSIEFFTSFDFYGSDFLSVVGTGDFDICKEDRKLREKQCEKYQSATMSVLPFVSLRRFSYVVCGQAGLRWPSISKLMATTKVFAKIRPQVTGQVSPVLKGVCEDL